MCLPRASYKSDTTGRITCGRALGHSPAGKVVAIQHLRAFHARSSLDLSRENLSWMGPEGAESAEAAGEGFNAELAEIAESLPAKIPACLARSAFQIVSASPLGAEDGLNTPLAEISWN